MPIATTMQTSPGTQYPALQPQAVTTTATPRNVRPSPMAWAVLQRPYIRPRSRFENHCAIATAPAGAPNAWNQPLSAQSTTQTHSVVENPMPMLTAAETSTPVVKKTRRFAWSARKPFESLPIAYV